MLAGEAYWAEEAQALTTYALVARMLAGVVEDPTARAARRGVALPAAFDAWFRRATATAPHDRFDRASTQIAELAEALGTAAPRMSLFGWSAVTQPPAGASTLTPPEALGPVSRADLRAATPAAPSRAAQSPRPAREATQAPAARGIIALGVFMAAVVGLFGTVRALGSTRLQRAAAAAPASSSMPAGAPSPSSSAESGAPAPSAPASVAAAAASTEALSAEATKRRGVHPTAQARSSATVRAPAACLPPYTVDAIGVRHAKPECL
jgi:serine/threonine-protein kinase